MPGLLNGVRVLDLTNVLAGPFACYLAVLGAEVIKVEAGQRRSRPPARRRRRAQPAAHGRLLPRPERRQAVGHAQPQARGRQGGVPAAGRQLGRGGRELPARRHGPAGAGLRRAQGGQARSRLLRDLGLRPGRAAQGQPRLRPDHPGPVRRDERYRRPRSRRCGSATRSATRSAASPPPSRSPRRWSSGPAPARASASTCRCSKPRSSPWAGRSPTG